MEGVLVLSQHNILSTFSRIYILVRMYMFVISTYKYFYLRFVLFCVLHVHGGIHYKTVFSTFE